MSQNFLRQRKSAGKKRASPEISDESDLNTRVPRDEVVWGKTPGGEGEYTFLHLRIPGLIHM
jgi:hypothetical protein